MSRFKNKFLYLNIIFCQKERIQATLKIFKIKMDFINENLQSIYDELYTTLDGSPFEKFEQIKSYCWESQDRWDLSEDEYGDIADAYEGALHNYLTSKYNDFEL